MKRCSKCKVTKPKSEFNKDRVRADGLQSLCKACKKQRGKQHYANNKPKLREYQKQYRKQYRVNNTELYLLNAAKARAKRRGLEFNLEISDIVLPEFCPALGLKLETHGGKKKDNSYSLDRIDSSKGYIKGNVIVTSWRANKLKSDATTEELQKLVTFYKNLEK